MTERGELTPFRKVFKEITERRGWTLEQAIERTVAEAEKDGLGAVVREEIGWLVYFCPEKYEKWRAKEDAELGVRLQDYIYRQEDQ